MYDEKMIERICNVECTEDEISNYYFKKKKATFCPKGGFDKYYDLNKILLAIEKFQSQQVDEFYMSAWADVYHRIIEDGARWNCCGDDVTLEIYLKRRIVGSLVALWDYFDVYGWRDPSHVELYKNEFVFLDKLLRDVSDCDISYAISNLDRYNPQILIVNNKERYCFDEEYPFPYDKGEILPFKKIKTGCFRKTIRQLRNKGYVSLTVDNN